LSRRFLIISRTINHRDSFWLLRYEGLYCFWLCYFRFDDLYLFRISYFFEVKIHFLFDSLQISTYFGFYTQFRFKDSTSDFILESTSDLAFTSDLTSTSDLILTSDLIFILNSVFTSDFRINSILEIHFQNSLRLPIHINKTNKYNPLSFLNTSHPTTNQTRKLNSH